MAKKKTPDKDSILGRLLELQKEVIQLLTEVHKLESKVPMIIPGESSEMLHRRLKLASELPRDEQNRIELNELSNLMQTLESVIEYQGILRHIVDPKNYPQPTKGPSSKEKSATYRHHGTVNNGLAKVVLPHVWEQRPSGVQNTFPPIFWNTLHIGGNPAKWIITLDKTLRSPKIPMDIYTAEADLGTNKLLPTIRTAFTARTRKVLAWLGFNPSERVPLVDDQRIEWFLNLLANSTDRIHWRTVFLLSANQYLQTNEDNTSSIFDPRRIPEIFENTGLEVGKYPVVEEYKWLQMLIKVSENRKRGKEVLPYYADEAKVSISLAEQLPHILAQRVQHLMEYLEINDIAPSAGSRVFQRFRNSYQSYGLGNYWYLLCDISGGCEVSQLIEVFDPQQSTPAKIDALALRTEDHLALSEPGVTNL